jgi:hypothetical protein
MTHMGDPHLRRSSRTDTGTVCAAGADAGVALQIGVALDPL